MSKNNSTRLIWFLLAIIIFPNAYINAQSSNLVYGSVIDDYGLPAANAVITFTNESDNSISYICTTSTEGSYQFSITVTSVAGRSTLNNSDFSLMQNYPNPFNPTTIIPFILEKSSFVNLSIYNILGQKVKTVVNEVYPAGNFFSRWDGTNDHGNSVATGVYIYRIISNGRSQSKKMLLIDGGGGPSSTNAVSMAMDYYTIKDINKKSQESYRVTISRNGIKPFEQSGIQLSFDSPIDFVVEQVVPVPFAVQGDYLGIYNGTGYDQLFVKGVNLGVSVPGTQPGELAATREQYDSWLERMGDIGLNTLRIYTLHYPRFYQALYDYNTAHPDKQLYLFQGIWLNEDNPSNDLEQLSQEFDSDIEEVIDCVHGNRTIEHRFGKAYGDFDTDISKWIIGYIIGREISPGEVLNTNSLYPDSTSYDGEAIQLALATPGEIWVVKRLDHSIVYERGNYAVERPVSLSSWPTLDPLSHPTEDSTRSDEDKTFLDLSDVETTNAPAGIFASYHAYPYYPDFISEDTGYIQYSDHEGPNSYLGYLTDLKNHYSEIPLIIAEFGVPSSWGNAHFAHSGMHHGGIDEKLQGDYNVRMMQNIYDTGCGGGLIFSWIDEWFKQSWITNPIGPDGSRRHLWHNVTNPEQNFGLITFDPEPVDYSKLNAFEDTSSISKVQADLDNQFFHVKITLKTSLAENDSLIIGLDTYRSDLGESILPDGSTVSNRAEFSLIISNSDSAQLYVTQAYDLFGIYHDVSEPEQLYHSISTDGAPWVSVRWKNNYYDDAIQNIGMLRKRDISETAASMDAVIVNNNIITVRIPWTLLQFTDPSSLKVMHDDRSTTERETELSDGLALSVLLGDAIIETERFLWDGWNIAPVVIEREKESLQIFKEGLALLPDYISIVNKIFTSYYK
ncbi:T9SS type A sorting domain-containing protein [candidate division KSB1 bacterium]